MSESSGKKTEPGMIREKQNKSGLVVSANRGSTGTTSCDESVASDSEESHILEEMTKENITTVEQNLIKLEDLNYPLPWENIQIKEILTNSTNGEDLTEEEINKIVHFYHKFRTVKLPKGRSSSGREPRGIQNKNANDLVELKIASIYAKFIQEKIGKGESVDFLNFLRDRYLDPRAMINHYFDKIYILNLDRRPDRMQNMTQRLKKWGIYNYVRWSAVDGTQSPHWEEWKHYTKSRMTRMEKLRYKRKAIASAGSWAILKSMYHLIADAKRNGYKRILVLQDDNLFHKNFAEEFMKIPSYIPDKKWKLLYLGATQHAWTHIMKSKHYYHPCGTADGAFAVGIHHSLYDELLEEILKFDCPVDSGALRNLQKKYLYSSYVVYPNLLIADIRDSDLRGSRDLRNFGKRFRWDINLYNI